MKYALIGCGRISSNHIMAAQKNGLEIAAICDLNYENMKDKALKYHLDETVGLYESHQDLLEKEKPELVAIATESGKHAKIAMDCINLGCHVIIEKPIALSIRDAEQIIAAAEKSNVKVCVCHQNRFNKPIQKIYDAVQRGCFGRLLYGTAHIRWSRDQKYYSAAKWRGTWEQDGGALMNQCIHDIDLLRWLMGDEVVEVVGMTDRLNHDYIEAEDLGIALVRFKNNSYGIIEGTTDIYPKNLEETLYLFGEKGTVKAGGAAVNRIEEWHFAEDMGNTEEIKERYSEEPSNLHALGHSRLYADMINAIKNDSEPLVDGEAGKRALELVLAIYKSAAEGKTISLPLQEGSTADFEGRF